MSDLLDLVEGIDYSERSSGSETTKKLAQMIVGRQIRKYDRSLEFQKQAAERNKSEFNSPMQAPPQPQPQTLDHAAHTPGGPQPPIAGEELAQDTDTENMGGLF